MTIEYACFFVITYFFICSNCVIINLWTFPKKYIPRVATRKKTLIRKMDIINDHEGNDDTLNVNQSCKVGEEE